MDQIHVKEFSFNCKPSRNVGTVFCKGGMKNILMCSLLLIACHHRQKQNASIDLQRLGSILPTANWRVINGADTSYIYFSRQFDNSYKAYEYKLVHGDSVVAWDGGIEISGDSVIWSWNHHLLFLLDANDTKASWRDGSSGESYVLQKINDSSLQLRSSSMYLDLKKTLPLSTFLVRAKYDYEYGTRFADSAEIPPRKIRKAKSSK